MNDATKPPQQHIFIGIPTMGQRVTNAIADLCEAALMMQYMPNCPWRFTVKRSNGFQGVAYARNKLVGDFLATDAEVLWFLDHDTKPSANSFELLLLQNRFDIAAGIYPAFQKREGQKPTLTFGAYYENADGTWRVDPLPETGNPIIPVDGVMMGATIIKRALFEDERLLLSPVEDPKAPPFFQTPIAPNGKLLATEDVDFCSRAGKLGYRIGVHSGIKWGHLKELDLLTVAGMMVDAYLKGQTAVEDDAPLIEVAA